MSRTAPNTLTTHRSPNHSSSANITTPWATQAATFRTTGILSAEPTPRHPEERGGLAKFQGGFDWDFVDQALHKNINTTAVNAGGNGYLDPNPQIIAALDKKAASLQPGTGNGEEYCYGGDYNSYDPPDNNFNCNGIIGPDRQLNPHAYELAYQYQNIWAGADNFDGTVPT